MLRTLWDWLGHFGKVKNLLWICSIIGGGFFALWGYLVSLPAPIAALIGIWASAGLIFLASQFKQMSIKRHLPTWFTNVQTDFLSQKVVATREELRQPLIRDRVVDVVSIPRDGIFIRDKLFINCDIVGPAVVTFDGHSRLQDCSFETPYLEAMLWEVPDDREGSIGILVFFDCVFRRCWLRGLGIAGQKSELDTVRRGFSMAPGSTPPKPGDAGDVPQDEKGDS